ncbi:hypothetical protein GGI04_000393 [Coemansia thaxteri]|uniref:C2H2-type domain-containing protein n=1 Tax=Coemansia thaxteri TaxID=2663907 RepID=A0A9W8B7S8_9FUNG|nr:hypothetical protein H4R26_005925 [Coemansia thaxteri]KAJ2009240.1 hypothetical protein GGI04_000620 [Coemansia thaxteri]KAJ2009483.1 hypothetical protein GGI04_000393 [Coemansia thaxteri]KAJ2469965.1 hypothetical protein EV174_006184 [Coemansia sp. RSA 2320]KAJ2474172.1 hypothetical protein GGI02_000299 [Coemansia sp. RSA 2322]
MDVGALLDTSCHGDAAACKDFVCSWADCARSFARKSDLVRHFRIHTGVKPFECPWADCDKRFIQRSALKVHFRTHSGERPHTCEECDRSFSDSSSLARHRRTHTGVRPYGCSHHGCLKRFTRKTSLRKHMLSHAPARARSAAAASSRASSATASPEFSPAPTLSPLAPHYYAHGPLSLKLVAPISPICASGASTACSSPAMHGMQGATLPPISALLR